MKDGGSEPAIRRSLGPDHHMGDHATCNLASGKRCEEEAQGVDAREGGRTL
jgi:hypothetical protein